MVSLYAQIEDTCYNMWESFFTSVRGFLCFYLLVGFGVIYLIAMETTLIMAYYGASIAIPVLPLTTTGFGATEVVIFSLTLIHISLPVSIVLLVLSLLLWLIKHARILEQSRKQEV